MGDALEARIAELADLRRRLKAAESAAAEIRRNLDAGRGKGIERMKKVAVEHERLVLDFARADLKSGEPEYGRASRIVRNLELHGVGLSHRTVTRILRKLASVRAIDPSFRRESLGP